MKKSSLLAAVVLACVGCGPAESPGNSAQDFQKAVALGDAANCPLPEGAKDVLAFHALPTTAPGYEKLIREKIEIVRRDNQEGGISDKVSYSKNSSELNGHSTVQTPQNSIDMQS